MLPEGWRRLVRFATPGSAPGAALCLEPHDLAASKLVAYRANIAIRSATRRPSIQFGRGYSQFVKLREEVTMRIAACESFPCPPFLASVRRLEQ